MPDYTLDVTAGTIAVFDIRLEDPFNEWEAPHRAQGFAWRPSSVSFRTVNESGPTVIILDDDEHHPDAIPWIKIEVPFVIPAHGCVEIACVEEDHVLLRKTPGHYVLRYECGTVGDSIMMFASFRFTPSEETVIPRVVQNGVVFPPDRITMKARAAVWKD